MHKRRPCTTPAAVASEFASTTYDTAIASTAEHQSDGCDWLNVALPDQDHEVYSRAFDPEPEHLIVHRTQGSHQLSRRPPRPLIKRRPIMMPSLSMDMEKDAFTASAAYTHSSLLPCHLTPPSLSHSKHDGVDICSGLGDHELAGCAAPDGRLHWTRRKATVTNGGGKALIRQATAASPLPVDASHECRQHGCRYCCFRGRALGNNCELMVSPYAARSVQLDHLACMLDAWFCLADHCNGGHRSVHVVGDGGGSEPHRTIRCRGPSEDNRCQGYESDSQLPLQAEFEWTSTPTTPAALLDHLRLRIDTCNESYVVAFVLLQRLDIVVSMRHQRLKPRRLAKEATINDAGEALGGTHTYNNSNSRARPLASRSDLLVINQDSLLMVLLSLLSIAAKLCDDVVLPSTSTFAIAAGIEPKTLCRAENAVLKCLGYRVHVSAWEYQASHAVLHRHFLTCERCHARIVRLRHTHERSSVDATDKENARPDHWQQQRRQMGSSREPSDQRHRRQFLCDSTAAWGEGGRRALERRWYTTSTAEAAPAPAMGLRERPSFATFQRQFV